MYLEVSNRRNSNASEGQVRLIPRAIRIFHPVDEMTIFEIPRVSSPENATLRSSAAIWMDRLMRNRHCVNCTADACLLLVIEVPVKSDARTASEPCSRKRTPRFHALMNRPLPASITSNCGSICSIHYPCEVIHFEVFQDRPGSTVNGVADLGWHVLAGRDQLEDQLIFCLTDEDRTCGGWRGSCDQASLPWPFLLSPVVDCFLVHAAALLRSPSSAFQSSFPSPIDCQ